MPVAAVVATALKGRPLLSASPKMPVSGGSSRAGGADCASITAHKLMGITAGQTVEYRVIAQDVQERSLEHDGRRSKERRP